MELKYHIILEHQKKETTMSKYIRYNGQLYKAVDASSYLSKDIGILKRKVEVVARSFKIDKNKRDKDNIDALLSKFKAMAQSSYIASIDSFTVKNGGTELEVIFNLYDEATIKVVCKVGKNNSTPTVNFTRIG